MEIKQVECYKFAELGEKVRKHLIEKEIKRINELGDIRELLEEQFKEQVGEAGYPTNDIRYRLSYSQGDGVAFYSDDTFNCAPILEHRLGVDLAACLGDNLSMIMVGKVAWISAKIHGKCSHYHHHNSMRVEIVEDEETIPSSELLETWTELLQADVADLSKELEAAGYKLIEAMEDEAFIAEDIERQDKWYLSNGTEVDDFIIK